MRTKITLGLNVFVPVLCFIFLFSVPFSLQAGQPDAETIVVTGTGHIIENDDAGAREAAIAESLVTAVGLVMAEIIPVDLLVSNFETLNTVMYDKTERFINGYRVLTETKYKNLYRVAVQAKVSTNKIQKELSSIGIIVDNKKAPKLLLLVAEQNIDDLLPKYWWQVDAEPTENNAEKILETELQNRGFIIIRHNTVPLFDQEGINLDTPEPDDASALAMAGKYNADIVIVGKAFADQAQNTMGEELRSFKGTVKARAIDVKTGKEVAGTFQTDLSLNADEIEGGNQAITRVSALAGEDLARQMTAAVEKTEEKITKIKISVKGTNYLANFVKFRNILNSVPNVKNTLTSEMKSDQSTIVVDYTGNTQMLAQALMLKSFDTFGINISEVAENHLNIELVNKTSASRN